MTIPRPVAVMLFLLPWLAVAVVGWWLLVLRFPPSGIWRASFALDGQSPWFDPFLPGQRASSPGVQPEGWVGQRITMDPVYASARTPGLYDAVDVALELRALRQPLLELGILRDPVTFALEMHPVWSEELSQGWHPARVGDVRGFVRDVAPDSALVSQDYEHMMVWFATTTSPERMDEPRPFKTTDVSLRGGHDFYTIPVNGEIAFTFAIQDVNRSRGGNAVVFRLSKDDETVWTDAVGTGGTKGKRPTEVYEKNIRVRDVKPGIYRLSLIADDDIFIRSIGTTARHWVMGPRLYVGDTVGYRAAAQPLAAWTNSRHLALETFHTEGLQAVSLGSAAVTLLKTHESYALDRTEKEWSGDAQILAPKGDVRIVGDGYFALDRDALFLPRPRRLTDASHPAKEGVIAVLTNYQPPEKLSDGWMRVHTAFALSPQDDRLKFSLAAPGIFFVRRGAVDVRAVTMTYTRPAISWNEWWVVVRHELVAAWKRL